MSLKIEVGEHAVVTRQAVREPQLIKLSSGDLLLTYHVQADMHFAERHGLRSRDGGRTWQDEPHRAHREQAIGQGADGTVLAPDVYTFERRPGEYAGSYYRSDDGGATFSGPHELTLLIDRVAARGYPEPDQFPPADHPLYKFYQALPEYYRPIVARSSQRQGPGFWRYLVEAQGRWLAAIYGQYHGDSFYRTMLAASEDRGRTWVFVNNIADFRDGVPGDGFCEPALAAAADGSLLCVMRRGAHLPLAQCRSLDHGHSWSEPELLAGHGVDPDLCLMSNGVLACSYGRPGLHLMFSPDGAGHAWGYHTRIGEWPSSTYMGLAEVAPGELLVVYDRCEAPGAGRDPDKCHVGSCRVRIS